ncbi:hypothetical protein E4U23_004511 [Claviceps purpurea]|nr:hypothetical protein E4U23_004511 [Claviceps purpurea]
MPSEAPPADFLRCQMLDLYEYFNEYQADHEEPYIAGDEPSIADVAALEWISCHGIQHELWDSGKNLVSHLSIVLVYS